MLDKIKEIAKARNLTLDQAAAEIGVDRTHLWRISQRTALGSKETWRKIIAWSHGEITPNSLFTDQIQEIAARDA